jgi:hypothetical protein
MVDRRAARVLSRESSHPRYGQADRQPARRSCRRARQSPGRPARTATQTWPGSLRFRRIIANFLFILR